MLTINSSSNYNQTLNFGTKIPTRDVISLATQRQLSEDFCDVLNAANKITERTNSTHDLIACGDRCRDALLEQFPVLKDVVKNTNKFFKNQTRSEKEIDTFVSQQIEMIGSQELDVTPIKIDPQVYYQYNQKIASEKPVIAYIHQ